MNNDPIRTLCNIITIYTGEQCIYCFFVFLNVDSKNVVTPCFIIAGRLTSPNTLYLKKSTFVTYLQRHDSLRFVRVPFSSWRLHPAIGVLSTLLMLEIALKEDLILRPRQVREDKCTHLSLPGHIILECLFHWSGCI